MTSAPRRNAGAFIAWDSHARVGGLAVTTDSGMPACLAPMLGGTCLNGAFAGSTTAAYRRVLPGRARPGARPAAGHLKLTSADRAIHAGTHGAGARSHPRSRTRRVLRLRGRPSVLLQPGRPEAARRRPHPAGFTAGRAGERHPRYRQRRAKPGGCSPDAIARPSRRGDPPGGAAGRDCRERGEPSPSSWPSGGVGPSDGLFSGPCSSSRTRSRTNLMKSTASG